MCPIIIISSLGFAKKMLRCQSKCDMITLENALAKSLKDSPLGSFGIVEKLCNNASKSNDFLGIPWKISFCHKVIFWAKLQASGQRATKKVQKVHTKRREKMTIWSASQQQNNRGGERDWLMHTCQGEQKKRKPFICMYTVQESPDMLYKHDKVELAENNEPHVQKKRSWSRRISEREEEVEKRWIVMHIILLVR